jgi:ATP-dependent RNA helicase RhlE
MNFADLGLAEEIVRAVTEHGYTTPTPIQTQAIPAVLSGGDLLAGAQTGTGKTAGFVLPILQRLSDKSVKGPSSGRPPIRALILTPTRELAAQVEESVRVYGKHTKLSSMVMFGGVGINPQIQRLRSRVDILVATPGRLLDHVGQKTLDLSGVQILVLDEADRMLDMGFIRDIKKILALLPKQRQNLLFSATFSDDIKALADSLLNQPALIEVARRNATADNIAQKVYSVDRDRKRQLLSHLIKAHQWYQVLVFTRTKHGANRLAEQLIKDDIPALAIHGNKSQSARTRALAEFKSGQLQVLVATDIAARGIDISELPHVVNYELPNVPEDYVHRIGRTGRAGAEGEAISLVCVDELDYLRGIERLIKRQLDKEIIPGFEPDPNARPEPIQLRSQEHRQGRGQPRGQGAGKPRQPGTGQAKTATGQPGVARPKARPGGEVAGGRPGGASHRSGGRHR